MVVPILAFFSEYLDSALGMGYGTALAPILIIMGYDALIVVPAILISQLFTDIAACVCHHRANNVNLKLDSHDFKIGLTLGLISAAGVIISVLVAIKIPAWLLKAYIGLLVASMGILILCTHKKSIPFSWRKLCGIGFLASFNKGISGGGYGPLVMGGQLLSGVNPKSAIGITAFAEAITCLIGFILYWVSGKTLDWKLIGTLIVFATLAVPLAAHNVKHVFPSRLKIYVGIMITILGFMTLLRIAGG